MDRRCRRRRVRPFSLAAGAESPTLFGTAIAEDGTLDITRPTGRVTVSPTELRSLLSRAYQPVADLVAQVLRDAPPDTARLAAAPPRPPAARAAR